MKVFTRSVALLAFLFGLPPSAMGLPLTRAELDSVLRYYRSVSRLEVGFHQTKYLKEMNLKLDSQGTLKLERPGSVVWKITKPSPLLVTLDEKGVRIESGVGAQKTKEAIVFEEGGKAAASLKGIVAWLKLDSGALMKQYRINSLGKNRYEMIARENESSPFESLTMTLHSGNHLEKLQIKEKSGDTLEIRFDSPHVERAP